MLVRVKRNNAINVFIVSSLTKNLNIIYVDHFLVLDSLDVVLDLELVLDPDVELGKTVSELVLALVSELGSVDVDPGEELDTTVVLELVLVLGSVVVLELGSSGKTGTMGMLGS